MTIPINFEIEDRLINNSISRLVINNMPFKVTKSLILKFIIPLTIPQKRMKNLENHIANYYRIIYPKSDKSFLYKKATIYTNNYKSKRCDDYILFNLNYQNTLKYVDKYVIIQGISHLQQAIAYNRGIIAVGSHVGSQVLGFFALMVILHRLHTDKKRIVKIVSAPDIKEFKNIFSRLKYWNKNNVFDFEFIWTENRKYIEAIKFFEALKKKCILTTNLDVLAGGNSQKKFKLLNTFHIRLPAIIGAAKLALLTDSIILPWHNYVDKNGILNLVIEEQLNPACTRKTQSVDFKQNVVNLSNTLFKLLENWVQEYPEQWIYWDRLDELTN